MRLSEVKNGLDTDVNFLLGSVVLFQYANKVQPKFFCERSLRMKCSPEKRTLYCTFI